LPACHVVPPLDEVDVLEELDALEELAAVEELDALEELDLPEELDELDELDLPEELDELDELDVLDLPELEELAVVEELELLEEVAVLDELPVLDEPPPVDELELVAPPPAPPVEEPVLVDEPPAPVEELVVSDEPPAPVGEPLLLDGPELLEEVVFPLAEPEPQACSSAKAETNRGTARVDSRIMGLLWMKVAACLQARCRDQSSAFSRAFCGKRMHTLAILSRPWPSMANAGLPWPISPLPNPSCSPLLPRSSLLPPARERESGKAGEPAQEHKPPGRNGRVHHEAQERDPRRDEDRDRPFRKGRPIHENEGGREHRDDRGEHVEQQLPALGVRERDDRCDRQERERDGILGEVSSGHGQHLEREAPGGSIQRSVLVAVQHPWPAGQGQDVVLAQLQVPAAGQTQ
jgi:hypothetical protein